MLFLKKARILWFDNMVIPKTAKNIEGAHHLSILCLIRRMLHKIRIMSAIRRQIKSAFEYLA